MNKKNLHILFACSELTPWVKTGGLADVCGSLPQALKQAGIDVRIILPGYKSVLDKIPPPEFVSLLKLPLGTVTICRSKIDDIDVLLVNHDAFTNRAGNPYMSDTDRPWPDNAFRFALFSQAVCEIAKPSGNSDWQADIVHCNDWQTGLVPALLSQHANAPATVFTIHNLAYQGNITIAEYNRLHLPEELLIQDGLEFWGQASFIKGGIAYADRINTVSPTYAEEITSKEFGCGMEGLLLHRRRILSGILNGIDLQTWDPQTDPHIATNYSANRLELKKENKLDLQKQLNLTTDPDAVLFGVISRLAVQKGIDLIINAIEQLHDQNFQLALLGSGDSALQEQLKVLSDAFPERIATIFGFDEKLSHKIEAGADVFLMPSRYEPCGLNQMYSHRYGTLPLVNRVGGLADTVVDYTGGATNNTKDANGFVIESADAELLSRGMLKAIACFDDKSTWLQLQQNAMMADYSWAESASHYIRMYEDIAA